MKKVDREWAQRLHAERWNAYLAREEEAKKRERAAQKKRLRLVK